VSIAIEEQGQRVKIVHEGETVDAEEVEFQRLSEVVGVYKLADGVTVQMKHSVKRIYRLCDKKKADGSPIYIVTGEARLTVNKDDGKEEEDAP